MNAKELFEKLQGGDYLRITNAEDAPATLKMSHDRQYIHFQHFGTFACKNDFATFERFLPIVAKAEKLSIKKVSGFYSEN